MAKKKAKKRALIQAPQAVDMSESLRLDPEKRLCSRYDSTGIAKYRVGSTKKMGMRVLDDCAEEHIM